MGLKSGSRDAGLDDSEEEEEESSESQGQQEPEAKQTEEAASRERENEERERTRTHEEESRTDSTPEVETNAGQQTVSSIPYKLRRDKVNEGREQVPYFLRGDIIEAEDELQDTLERMVGEDVYKSDYREASMVVAQRNPELVAEVLREWGYDLDSL